jgi:NAD+ diphosphatase
MSSRLNLSSFEPPSVKLANETAVKRYILVNLVAGQPSSLRCDQLGALQLYTPSQIETLLPSTLLSTHYLGAIDKQSIWVAVVGAEQCECYEEGQWLGLRAQLNKLDENWFALASRALQLSQWFQDHKFCGRCGLATAHCPADGAKICSSCQLSFYPRISPCMIVLITRGDEILLAHHRRSNRPMYSTLAGFVEAGERVEQTVMREVMEEVGLEVGGLEYFTSQSWPFPHQLMLGFFARYVAGEICIDNNEIVDAQWFHIDHLPEVPSPTSIAGQLINHYIKQRSILGSAI